MGLRLPLALLASLTGALAAWPARAAFETEVLSAVEKTKTLPDLHLSVGYDRLQKRAKITREWIQEVNGVEQQLDVKELRYTEIQQRLLVGARVGLYHDLEFHLTAPIILAQDSDIRFSAGVDPSSTIYGTVNADDPASTFRYPITQVPQARERSGFGDMTFGLAWSPVTDQKDEAYPTLTLRADVIAPTGKTRDPTEQAALPGGSGGSVGMGATTFDLSIGLSRRMQDSAPALDPYMVFGAQIPVAGTTQKQRGMEPPPSGRFLVGTEIIVSEDPPTEQRYAVDVSFGVTYVGQGRTFSELSDYLPNFNQTRVPTDIPVYADYDNPANYATQIDGASCGRGTRADGTPSGVAGVPCGELTKVDEYVQMRATLTLDLKPAPYTALRAGVSFGVNTDHFLTAEKVGTDTDPASAANQSCGASECVGRVNVVNSLGQDERSPYFDPRYDTPGRRLRIEETTNFVVFVNGIVTF